MTWGISWGSDTPLDLDLLVTADNSADVYMDGAHIGSTSAYNQQKKIPITLPSKLHIFKFVVTNSGGPTGLSWKMVDRNGVVFAHSRLANNTDYKWHYMGRGGRGQTHPGDGGGGGGGGGGFMGGEGGKYRGGDIGGYSGWPGVSYFMDDKTWDEVISASIKYTWWPLDSAQINHFAGSERRQDGSFTVTSRLSKIDYRGRTSTRRWYRWRTYEDVYDTWFNVKNVALKQNGSWVDIKTVYIKKNNVWEPVFIGDTFIIEPWNTSREQESGYLPDKTVDTQVMGVPVATAGYTSYDGTIFLYPAPAATYYDSGGGGSGGDPGPGPGPATCSADAGCGGGGCFIGSTLIDMYDGSKKKIEDIREGDLVVDARTSAPNKVIGIKVLEYEAGKRIFATRKGEIPYITEEHPWYDDNGELCAISEEAEYLAPWLGPIKIVEVPCIETTTQTTVVYNLIFENGDSHYANGLPVSNIVKNGGMYVLHMKGYITYEEYRGYVDHLFTTEGISLDNLSTEHRIRLFEVVYKLAKYIMENDNIRSKILATLMAWVVKNRTTLYPYLEKWFKSRTRKFLYGLFK